jgi:hypothetical protein
MAAMKRDTGLAALNPALAPLAQCAAALARAPG